MSRAARIQGTSINFRRGKKHIAVLPSEKKQESALEGIYPFKLDCKGVGKPIIRLRPIKEEKKKAIPLAGLPTAQKTKEKTWPEHEGEKESK